jgi:hypothetical protein
MPRHDSEKQLVHTITKGSGSLTSCPIRMGGLGLRSDPTRARQDNAAGREKYRHPSSFARLQRDKGRPVLRHVSVLIVEGHAKERDRGIVLTTPLIGRDLSWAADVKKVPQRPFDWPMISRPSTRSRARQARWNSLPRGLRMVIESDTPVVQCCTVKDEHSLPRCSAMFVTRPIPPSLKQTTTPSEV